MSTSWTRVICDALGTTGKADANGAEDKVCQDGETILMRKVSKCRAVNRKVLSAKPVRGAEYFPLRKFSPAFWLTTQRYLLPRTRHSAEKRPLSGLAQSSADLLGQASPPPIPGGTLRVSVDRCAFG